MVYLFLSDFTRVYFSDFPRSKFKVKLLRNYFFNLPFKFKNMTQDKNCIFCKIVNKEIPAEIIYEDENYIAFKDINPKAPIHILIIPKKHLESFHLITSDDDKKVIKGLLDIAWKLIDKL